MIGRRTLVATALLSMISATAMAQQEPAAWAAANPDRDILNGGALTPAGRLGLENLGGAAAAIYSANQAAAGLGNASGSIQPLAAGNARNRGRRRPSERMQVAR
jgi:hypothetical protein